MSASSDVPAHHSGMSIGSTSRRLRAGIRMASTGFCPMVSSILRAVLKTVRSVLIAPDADVRGNLPAATREVLQRFG